MKRAPGIYPGLSFTTYQAIEAWNPSLVKHGRKSMKHLRWEMEHPPGKTTDSMRLGQACHTAMLEPDEVVRRYVLWTGKRKAGKEWDLFCEANAGKQPLSEDEYAAAIGVRDAVRADAVAGPIMAAPGDRELSAVWNDPLGIACKGRIDFLTSDCIVDIKTTARIEPWSFRAVAESKGYHVSLAAYQDAILTLRGELLPVRIVCVETSPPFDVVVYDLDERELGAGRAEWKALLQRIQHCERTGEWPGVAAGQPLPLELKLWGVEEDESVELTMGGKPMSL